MAIEGILHMKGGVGETSYANNSSLQRKVIMEVKAILEENMTFMISNKSLKSCWKIADLGCSSVPNTLLSISNILNIIHNIGLKLNLGKPVCQIYLNDVFQNDFNTIFKLLPNFYQQEKEKNVGECFISATPGNFYGRLFLNNYIDFCHSSYSLHWLSQAPKDSTKKANPLNKGNICVTRTSPPLVYDAYCKQFQIDFKCFLELRFKELNSNGMMVLTFLSRETMYEITSCEVLSAVLNELFLEGLVEEEKLDWFDLPIYYPTIKEVRQVIKEEGSFTLQTLKTFKIGWDANLQEDMDDCVLDNKMRGEFIAKYHRAIFEPLLIVEFGENIVDEIFLRFAKLMAKLMESERLEYTNIVLFMTKGL